MSKLRGGLGIALSFAFGTAAATAEGAEPSCYDGVKNGPETDADCGGDCIPCDLDYACYVPRDCLSGRCEDRICAEQPYEAGAPVPRGYRVETSTRDAAASARKAGLLFFGVGYGAAYVGALAVPGRVAALYVPVIGPFTVLEGRETWVKGLLIADGVVQAAGAVLLIGGIAGSGEQLLRVDWAGLTLAPTAGPTGAGLEVMADF
jgi:hypothetical protein